MRFPSLLVLVLVCGCEPDDKDDTASSASLSGQLELAVSSLVFSDLQVGEQEDQTLVLLNAGDGPLAIHDVAFSDDSERVHWDLQGLVTLELEPGASHTLLVRFEPQSVANHDVMLRIGSDDPDGPVQTVDLRGEGLGTPSLYTSSTTLDFGVVDIGASVEQNLFLANYGTGDLHIEEVRVSDDATNYSLGLDPSGTVLPPGSEGGLVVVVFEPTYDGPLYGAVTIATDDPLNPELQVDLTGEGDVPSEE